jgi:hypothetical protein
MGGGVKMEDDTIEEFLKDTIVDDTTGLIQISPKLYAYLETLGDPQKLIQGFVRDKIDRINR